MSARRGIRRCIEPGCDLQVVTATISDNCWVWEISRHPSVTEDSALTNGMGIGYFYGAIVRHKVSADGTVEHSITRK